MCQGGCRSNHPIVKTCYSEGSSDGGGCPHPGSPWFPGLSGEKSGARGLPGSSPFPGTPTQGTQVTKPISVMRRGMCWWKFVCRLYNKQKNERFEKTQTYHQQIYQMEAKGYMLLDCVWYFFHSDLNGGSSDGCLFVCCYETILCMHIFYI